jgi:hypothetical protein
VRVTGYLGASGDFVLHLSEDASVPVTPPPHPLQPQPSMPALPFTPLRSQGADLTVGAIRNTRFYGRGPVWAAESSSGGQISDEYAYMFDCSLWNIGDIPVQWPYLGTPHPVMSQHMYRLKDGRLEQIGLSWLAHGFSSLNNSAFSGLGPCDIPLNGGSEQLGVNCSAEDSSAQLEQSDDYLGPRFGSDASLGTALYQYHGAVGVSDPHDRISRRIVVGLDDLRGDTNAGAYYFAEAAFIAADDSSWGNGRNNYATRLLRAETLFTTSIGYFGETYGRTSALELWSRMDPAVTLSRVNYVDSSTTFTDIWRHWTPTQPFAVQMPPSSWTTASTERNARFVAASKVFTNGDGTFDYEYAVLNVNSGRAGTSFAVRLPGAAAEGVDFKAPRYHSGDRILNNPWLNNAGSGGTLRWSVDPATAFFTPPGMSGQVAFAPNTLMWGTMYNFRFRARTPPAPGVARLGLTPPRDGTGYQGNSLAIEHVQVPLACTADIGSAGGVAGPDGALDNNDFIAFISAFFNDDMLLGDIGSQGGVAGPDNTLDNNDFIVFIDAFFNGCGS